MATLATIVVLHTLLAIGCKVGEGAPRVASCQQAASWTVNCLVLFQLYFFQTAVSALGPVPTSPPVHTTLTTKPHWPQEGLIFRGHLISAVQSGCEGFVSVWWVQQPPDEVLGWELACLTEPDFTVTVALSALQLLYTYAVIFQELYCSMALFTPRLPSRHHHTCSKIDKVQSQNHVTRPYKMDGGRRFQLR